MLQAATINVIQSYGAQQIKLIADSMKSEVARTALQGLLAGAGAAAQGQSATSAALGASASVVLNNLIDSAYGESSSTLSLAEREARKNLVSTLISGTTHALGGEAALANAAATIETENNFLVIPIPVPPPPILGCDNDIVQEANKNLAAALEKTVKGIYEGSEDIAYCVMVMNSRNPDLISDYVEYLKEKYLTSPTDGNQQLNSGIYPGDTKEHELSNPLKVILESIARSHSSNSKNSSDSLPNLGKNLAAAEKADLGGTGAPSPSGWGPEDEQNARNRDKKPHHSQKGTNQQINNFSRPLNSNDFGIQGHLSDLKGTFSVENCTATVRVDMIRGDIKNPLQIVKNLSDIAKSNGATTLRIEGTIANERLYNVLQQRYGLTTQGAGDVIIIKFQ